MNAEKTSLPLEITGYLECFNVSMRMWVPPSSGAGKAEELWFLAVQSYTLERGNIIVSIRGNRPNTVVHRVRVHARCRIINFSKLLPVFLRSNLQRAGYHAQLRSPISNNVRRRWSTWR
jgi:hypothetical protein